MGRKRVLTNTTLICTHQNKTTMDPNLAKAAILGDVDFLRVSITCSDNPNNILSHQHIPQNTKAYQQELGNIFHLAAWNAKQDFIQLAINIQPDPSIVHSLLTQPESDEFGLNPLHVAAKEGHIGIVTCIVDFYDRYKELEPKPWFGLDLRGMTPVHVALCHRKERCVLKLIEKLGCENMGMIWEMVDYDGNSPLLLAVESGCSQVALKIFNSGCPYSYSGRDGCTPFHFVPHSNDEVLKLLLEKHPELINSVEQDQYYTMLHQWVANGKLWPLQYIMTYWDNIDNTIPLNLKNQLLNLLHKTDKHGNNPYHVAARWRRTEIATILAEIYRKGSLGSIERVDDSAVGWFPWLARNNEGETPLGMAVRDLNESAYSEVVYLQEMIDKKCVVGSDDELLFVAVENGKYLAAEGVWEIQCRYGWGKYSCSEEIWHAALKYSNKSAKWMVEEKKTTFLNFMENESIKNTLHLVSEIGATQFLKWVLEKSPSALCLAPLAWVEACKRGHYSTIIAFIEMCSNFTDFCLDKQDTPLHHIRFQNSEHYREFLRISKISRLKNVKDCNGETPLHKAIRRRNLHLTEALLVDDDVRRHIKDKKHKTALDLLVQACREDQDWKNMCKSNGIFIPGLQTTYFQDKTNLLEVRSTLSVVAALLATITFTAGFTLPGGVKSDTTGKATLGNKAAFLAFLLTDAIAMCFSMLVLVCLIWSMVCEHERSLLLIDKSVPILLLALYSTLVAFMTGVYTVIPHKSIWVVVVILVLCSIFIVCSQKNIVYILMDKLIPFGRNRNEDDTQYGDELQLLEQGEARVQSG